MTFQLGRQLRVNIEFLIQIWLKGRDRMNSSRNAGTEVLLMGRARLH